MPRKKKTEEQVLEENKVETTAESVVETKEEPVVEQKPVIEQETVVTEPEEKTEKKFEKKKVSVRFSFTGLYHRIKDNLGLMLATFTASVIVVVLLAVVVFFAFAEGPEQVMVPDVMGKPLENGLIEMQVNELYPRISLRYSDVPGDEGTILDQDPKSGAIVKGNSRVNLVVSRGVIANQVGNYIGVKLDELKMNLQTLFAGSTRPLIVIGDIIYKPDTSEAGTILEQDPPEGTSITNPVKVNLVVSRGPQYENTKPPYLLGSNINDILQTITRSKLIFDFTSHIAEEGENPGTVVGQKLKNSETNEIPEFVPNYTRILIDMAMPEKETEGNVTGIFSATLDVFPYAVPMRLDAVPEEGNAYTIISFNHIGGELTLPYKVPSGTTLVLYSGDKVAARETVH